MSARTRAEAHACTLHAMKKSPGMVQRANSSPASPTRGRRGREPLRTPPRDYDRGDGRRPLRAAAGRCDNDDNDDVGDVSAGTGAAT